MNNKRIWCCEVRKGFSQVVTSELRLERQESTSQGKTWGEEGVSTGALRWNVEEE